MTQKNDRARLLENFSRALGELTTAAIADLSDENKLLLGKALASGGGDVRMLVVPNPLSIVCFLRAVAVDAPPHIIFTIAPDQTAGVTQ